MSGPHFTPLGEKIRIGDLILQERPNYESRKLCTLAAAQGVNATPGGLMKGTILGVLNPTFGVIGDVQKTQLVALPYTSLADVQTLVVSYSATSGTFWLRYKGTLIGATSTTGIAYNVSAANLQIYLQAAHPDLANATVGLVTNAVGNTQTYTITVSAANIAAAGVETIDTLDIVGDTTWRLTSTSDLVPVYITHTTIGNSNLAGARAVLLQDAPYSAATQTVLCLVREAKLKPNYLSYAPSNTAQPVTSEQATATEISAACANLERYGLMITAGSGSELGVSTFQTAQDVDLKETTTPPSQSIPGL